MRGLLTLKDLSNALNITAPNLSYYMKGREYPLCRKAKEGFPYSIS